MVRAPEGDRPMILPRLALAASLLLGAAGAASAAPLPGGDAAASGLVETAWAKSKGWGKKGWKGGRHYGWQRGRHLGWHKHRRAYRGDGYAVRRAYRPVPYGYAPYGYAPYRSRTVTIRY
jgi:hypothetical protein